MPAQTPVKPDPVLPLLLGHLLGVCPDLLEVGLNDTSADTLIRMPAIGQHEQWIIDSKSERQVISAHWIDHIGRKFPTLQVPLRADPIGTVGYLHLLFDNERRLDIEATLTTAKPIIACLAGHLRIATELSAAHARDRRNTEDLDLLSAIDTALVKAKSDSHINAVLASIGKRLDCEELLVRLTDLPNEFHWQAGPCATTNLDRRRRALNKLVIAAMKSRRVKLMRDEESGTATALACPILDSKGRAQGAIVARSVQSLDRWSVRLLRSVAPKFTRLQAPDREHDDLLGRREFLQRIDRHLESNPQMPRAVLCIDIDRLHLINERHGHDIGDEALARVVRTLTEAAPDSSFLARLAGDLMAMFVSDCDAQQFQALAAMLRAAVQAIELDGTAAKTKIDVSIGGVLLPDSAENAAQALNSAELSLRSAKSRGGGRVVLFGEEDASIMQRHADLTAIGRLQFALIGGDFRLFAQEIRPLGTEGSRKYEILTRMLDDSGELLAPAKFLSAAERYNMMPAFDRWVVAHSLQQLADADNMLEISMSMFSINLSGQSISEPDFVDFVVDAVANSGLPPDALCFEITESTAVRNIDAACDFIHRIRSTGCRVALDDFGAGYCSFGYLQDLEVDFIKIDGQFVRAVHTDPLASAIVQAIVSIAKVRSAQTVAEYAENVLILRRLAELGIDYGQGYAIAKPIPLADVLDSMESPRNLGLTDAFRVGS